MISTGYAWQKSHSKWQKSHTNLARKLQGTDRANSLAQDLH